MLFYILTIVLYSAQDDGDAGSPLASIVMQPHHSHIPDIAPDSNLIFEGMVFMYSVMTLCLQYINLYKTVWWLPHSNAKYALVSIERNNCEILV